MGQRDRPRRVRTSRRVVRPATDGVPENERDTIDQPREVNESREVNEPPKGLAPSPAEATPAGSVLDDWWHEQRPPHWG